MKTFAFLGLLLSGTALAQDVPPPAPAPAPSDDIVVSGLHDLDDPGSRVTTKTLDSDHTNPGAIVSRDAFSHSRRFARCATDKPSSSTRALLRKALDSRTNSTLQAAAQSRLLDIYAACTVVPFPRSINSPERSASLSTLLDGTYYDRGALYIEVLHSFAPDLRLTKANTADPAVIARFNARENALLKFRLKMDLQYFAATVCVVKTQPELAVKLVRTDGPRQVIEQLEAKIVNGSPACFGNAQKVYFDATQFRFYVADAVYRWAVAVKGVDSLIPD